jgi:ketosteroid isomerase-like protein
MKHGVQRRCAVIAEANKNVVLSFFENFSAGKVDAALALMTDSVTWWVAGKPDKFVLAGTKTKTQLRRCSKEWRP